MNILENEYLKVKLHPKGAEIIEIISKKNNVNYMWKRDPRQWASSAPILFPIIGKVRNDTLKIDGKDYHLTSHGFSRHTQYQVANATDSKVVYKLIPNDEIKAIFPYDFVLTVTYTLEGSTLSCNVAVHNPSSDDILFQVGGHPAFACPFYDGESSNDYFLEFNQNEKLDQKILDLEKGGMSHQTRMFLNNEKRFFVTQSQFNDDAIVVENFKSNMIALKSINHNHQIKFHMENFTHLGIWAAKHVGDLLAIEPWCGHTDYYDFDGELKDKVGVVKLSSKQDFDCTFKVEIDN